MAISRLDMERQLRKDGGVLTLEDAKRMAPPGESLAYINPEEAALLKSLGGAGEDINGTGIKSYFIKKIFKKAKRAVKKVVKSPLGKAAILAAPFLMSGAGAGGLGSIFGKAKGLGSLISGLGSKISGMSTLGKLGLIGGVSGLGGLMAARGQQEEDDDESIFDRGEGLDIDRIVRLAKQNDPQFRFLPGAEFTGAYAEGGRIGKEEGGPINLGMDLYLITKQALEKQGYSPGEAHEKALDASGMREYFDKLPKEKDGGRIGKQEGGIMNLGGMEMDLRGGGFVPLGAKEKADDVPARLSKNEFVMTADAVRAAGGGSVDKGADKMYKLMKGLEAQV